MPKIVKFKGKFSFGTGWHGYCDICHMNSEKPDMLRVDTVGKMADSGWVISVKNGRGSKDLATIRRQAGARGQTLVEYSLILALIILVVAAMMVAVSQDITAMFNNIGVRTSSVMH